MDHFGLVGCYVKPPIKPIQGQKLQKFWNFLTRDNWFNLTVRSPSDKNPDNSRIFKINVIFDIIDHRLTSKLWLNSRKKLGNLLGGKITIYNHIWLRANLRNSRDLYNPTWLLWNRSCSQGTSWLESILVRLENYNLRY